MQLAGIRENKSSISAFVCCLQSTVSLIPFLRNLQYNLIQNKIRRSEGWYCQTINIKNYSKQLLRVGFNLVFPPDPFIWFAAVSGLNIRLTLIIN